MSWARLWLAAASLAAGAGCRCGSDVDLTLNASGATFQKAAQEATIDGFTRRYPRIAVNYGAGGSGKGRQDFADRVVDFACSDAPYKAADVGKVKSEFFYIPNLLGAIVVAYNLEGVPTLQLSAPTIAAIFQRQITRWSDPRIAAENPGVTLPDRALVVARRSDGSGTTENFTKFLADAAGDGWKLKSGSTVEWPADTQAGTGNGGVAQLVMTTPGALGYVDLSDARAAGMTHAKIKNRSGAYVEATSASVAAATATAELQDNLIFSAVDSAAPAAYPIAAQSWCLVYARYPDAARAAAVKDYFTYLVTDAQLLLPEIDYAPISPTMRARALERIAKIEGP